MPILSQRVYLSTKLRLSDGGANRCLDRATFFREVQDIVADVTAECVRLCRYRWLIRSHFPEQDICRVPKLCSRFEQAIG